MYLVYFWRQNLQISLYCVSSSLCYFHVLPGVERQVFQWFSRFHFFHKDTSVQTLSNAFTLKKVAIKEGIKVHFVQQVLGPNVNKKYVCNYNHFDLCLELLPDGPSHFFPPIIWKNIYFRNLIITCRSTNKLLQSKSMSPIDTIRNNKMRFLPISSDIFKVIKRRHLRSSTIQFESGKIIKDSLPILHVKANVSSNRRLTKEYAGLFAVPFLGSMLGQFANVTYSKI